MMRSQLLFFKSLTGRVQPVRSAASRVETDLAKQIARLKENPQLKSIFNKMQDEIKKESGKPRAEINAESIGKALEQEAESRKHSIY